MTKKILDTPTTHSMALATGLLLLTACASRAPEPGTAAAAASEWQLVWQDEFDGNAIDRSKWQFEHGGHGWGNNELQHYTDRPENARIENGMLVIEARKETYAEQQYTSARLITKGLHSWQYGRIEARMKLPQGQGIWPAFWMLGHQFPTVAWPQAGEIDIMEFIGREPNKVYGTLHGPGYSGAQGFGGHIELPKPVSADFHQFAIEWNADEIRWFIDGKPFHRATPADVAGEWVYRQPFYLLLNLAVGGNWPGYPDASTSFPQQFQVDYVRVYQHTQP